MMPGSAATLLIGMQHVAAAPVLGLNWMGDRSFGLESNWGRVLRSINRAFRVRGLHMVLPLARQFARALTNRIPFGLGEGVCRGGALGVLVLS